MKRLEIFKRDNVTCQGCGSTTKTLHVHHCFYSPGMRPWDYADHVLITLCEDCHRIEEERKKAGIEEYAYKHLLRVWLDPLTTEIFLKIFDIKNKPAFFESINKHIQEYDG